MKLIARPVKRAAAHKVQDAARREGRPRWVRPTAVAALGAFTLGVVGLSVAEGQAGVNAAGALAGSQGSPSVLVTAGELETAAAESPVPVYWAGERAGEEIELTSLDDGTIYLRYLVDGASAGNTRDKYLTIATYASAGGYAMLEEGALADEATAIYAESGALLLTRSDYPNSVWFSFPDAAYQLEVYHPTAGIAFEMVASGEIVPLS